MKICCLILTAVLLLTASPSTNAQTERSPNYAITFNSFAKVKVGMTVSKASKALGVRLTTTDQGECRYYAAKGGFKNVGFMVNDGTIARFDVFERDIATDRGAKVGDSEARIKRLYKGTYKISRHKYVDGGHYISIGMKGGKHFIIFETDGKRVTSFRAGRSPEIEYVEGCS